MTTFLWIASGAAGTLAFMSGMLWVFECSTEPRNTYENRDALSAKKIARGRMAGMTLLWSALSFFFYWLGT